MIRFYMFGHENITSRHKTTFEITKDSHVTRKGDCIVGVGADYDLNHIKPLLAFEKLRIVFLEGNHVLDQVEFRPNPCFCDDIEMVFRKTDFISDRTFGNKATKSAFELSSDLISLLKEKKKIAVNIGAVR